MFKKPCRLIGMKAFQLVAVLIVSAFVIFTITTWSHADEPVQSDVISPKLKELLKERLATVRQLAKSVKEGFQSRDGTSIHQALEAIDMLLEVELESCNKESERILVFEKIIGQVKEVERLLEQLLQTRQALDTNILLAPKAQRLKYEIALERMRSKVVVKPK